MKALSIRIEDDLSEEFDAICRKTGYKKNTLLARLIESFVRHQKNALGERKGSKDPFAQVIGLMNIEPLLPADDEIDRIVYNS